MPRVLIYCSPELWSMTVHISEYTNTHFSWKCHLFLRTICAVKNLYVFHDVSLNGLFSSEQNVWLFRLLNLEWYRFKIHFLLQYNGYLVWETRNSTLCSLDKNNILGWKWQHNMERNHYQSSKTIFITSQILFSEDQTIFFFLKSSAPLSVHQTFNKSSEALNKDKDCRGGKLLPSVLPDSAWRGPRACQGQQVQKDYRRQWQ